MPDEINNEQQYTPVQLNDGRTLHFLGQLSPDQVRDKVAAFRFKEASASAQPGDPAYAVQQARQSLVQPKMTAAPGANPWDDAGPSNVGELVNSGIKSLAQKAGNWVNATDRGNLKQAASGQLNTTAVWAGYGPRMLRDTLSLAAAATEPKNVALATGIAAANTNPVTGVPVDAAIAAHGAYGLYKHRAALGDLVTTGQANPDELQAALSSGAEMAGGAAGTGAQWKAAGTVPIEQQNAAAQTALKPRGKGQEAFQEDLANSRPYLRGAQSQADLQNRIPPAKAEIWQPYEDAMQRIGGEAVNGPEGPTTYNQLENRRLELSSQLNGVMSKDPATLQTILQQGKTPADLTSEQNAIESLLDERLRQEGVNSPLVRQTYGNVKGIERLVSGRNTLSEPPQPYGLGKAWQTFNLWHPGTWLDAAREGLTDISAGRPWFSGKPTDVGIKEGFEAGGPKPTFASPTYPQPGPIGPQLPPPPPFPPTVPPSVPPQHAIEAIGTVQPIAMGPGTGGPRYTGPLGPPAPPGFPALPAPGETVGSRVVPPGAPPLPSSQGAPSPQTPGSLPAPPTAGPSALPPLPEPQPINPLEVLDLQQETPRLLTPDRVNQFLRERAAEENIRAGLGGNRADEVSAIREKHRATLKGPRH